VHRLGWLRHREMPELLRAPLKERYGGRILTRVELLSVLLVCACASHPHSPSKPDAAVDGPAHDPASDALNADASVDAGSNVAVDAPADTPSERAGDAPSDGGGADGDGGPTGVHAFDVTTTLPGGSVQVYGASSPGGKSVPISMAQTVTLVVDAAAGKAYVTNRILPLTFDGTAFHLGGAFAIQRGADEAEVTYSNVTFTIAGDRLTGTAHAEAASQLSFAGPPVALDLGNSPLSGGPDVTPPTFAIPAGPIDPFFLFDLVASELLPRAPHLRLVGSAGDVITYAPQTPDGPEAAALFDHPKIVLGYSETYRLDATGLVDFAGNAARGFAFDTEAPPPLVAPDGLESLPAGAFAGATIIDAAAGFPPVVTGTRSLFLALRSAAGDCDSRRGARVALRLAVPAGGHDIKLTSLGLNWSATPNFVGNLAFGFPGGSVGASSFNPTGPFTAQAVPGGGTSFVGIPQGVVIPLPPGATGEVGVEISADASFCQTPGPASGFVIDDLRVE
jgi:hypothetical protein